MPNRSPQEDQPAPKPDELLAASRPVLARIAKDRSQAPAVLKSLLAYLRRHLFDEGLTARSAFRACGLRDNTLPVLFHTSLGLPPGHYIRAARMEVACRLLRDTHLRIVEIAYLLGYSGPDVFSDAVRDWEGLRPTALRRELRKESSSLHAIVRDAGSSDLVARLEQGRLVGGLGDLCDLRLGRLSRKDTQALASRLDKIYGNQDHASCAVNQRAQKMLGSLATKHESTVSWLEIESQQAQALCQRIADEDPEDRRRLLEPLCFRTEAMFQVLTGKSRERGRQNRAEGVEYARLALWSLELIDPTSNASPRIRCLRCLAWARLGTAQCLAGDLQAAGRSTEEAQRLSEQLDASTKAEVLVHLANLRWHERRLDEADACLRRAIESLRTLSDTPILGPALVLHGAVAYWQGRLDTSTSHLEEALALAKHASDDRLILCAGQGLALTYLAAGQLDRAETVTVSLGALPVASTDTDAQLQLLWLDGRMAIARQRWSDAAKMLSRVYKGWCELDQQGNAALASLDLATAMLALGQPRRAKALASEAVILLRSLAIHAEAEQAVHVLAHALDEESLCTVSVRSARDLVERVVALHGC